MERWGGRSFHEHRALHFSFKLGLRQHIIEIQFTNISFAFQKKLLHEFILGLTHTVLRIWKNLH